MKNLCMLLACLLTLSACAATTPTQPDPTAAPQGNKEQTAYTPPFALDTTFSSLMDGLLADGGANSCVSPLSFKLALAMAYNGAEGGTAELLTELFGVSTGELNAWASEYLSDAQQYDGSKNGEYSPPSPELRIANSFWLRKGLESEISRDFTDMLAANFNAESGKFDKKPDPINKWVSDATNGKIKDILADIDPAALSYLVNALYFKAQWVNDFNENSTTTGEFTNSDGSKITTDMLHGGADSYINTERFEGVTKRLYGGFEFTAVMPKTSDTVTLDSILEAERDDSYTAIILTIPKFDFDTSVDFKEGSHSEFDALFAHHGMDGALSDNAKTDDLLISEIIHKTTFTLAEAGIEASAATVVSMAEGAAAPQETKEVEVVFDKPFYFTLTDRNGEVLFIGKVMGL
ncbi:serpin [Clostridia bacterium]|nr:serpin [Clostridia bacterium]